MLFMKLLFIYSTNKYFPDFINCKYAKMCLGFVELTNIILFYKPNQSGKYKQMEKLTVLIQLDGSILFLIYTSNG